MTAPSDIPAPELIADSLAVRPASLARRVTGFFLEMGPSSVRGRLIGLLLGAAVPVLAMAAFIAWQNYVTVAGQADVRVLMAREAAVARHAGALDGVERLLTGIAAILPPESSPQDCDAALRSIMRSQGDRLANLGLVDGEGRLRCSALPLGAATLPRGKNVSGEPWYAPVHSGKAVALGRIVVGAISHRRVIFAAVPYPAPGEGALVATVRVDWLAAMPDQGGTHTLVWFVGANGTPAQDDPAAAPLASELPPASELAAILHATGAVRARSRSGNAYAYAAAPIDGDLHMLVAEPAGIDLDRARMVLEWRLGQLCLLLLAGMTAVALGADRTVLRPLRRLARAVARWRLGGDFSPSGLEAEPQEVRDLSRSFAQAIDDLAQREAQLRRAVEQHDLLMQEMHHRVKNNLQIVASLLNLQSSRIRSPVARAEFQAARDRVRALATLHRHLYAYGDLQSLNMRSFLTELCGQLLQAMGEPPDDPHARIRLDIAAPELRISSDQAVPIALIVTEAVGNAAKHAFPGGRAGHIRVRLAVVGDAAELEVSDDGVGVPDSLAPDGQGGIGIQLIRGLSRQLGATMDMASGPGTRYLLSIPLRPLGERRAEESVA